MKIEIRKYTEDCTGTDLDMQYGLATIPYDMENKLYALPGGGKASEKEAETVIVKLHAILSSLYDVE